MGPEAVAIANCREAPRCKKESIAFAAGERRRRFSVRSSAAYGLRIWHNPKIMAVEMYRLQVGRERFGLSLQLMVAMSNEVRHVQDFHCSPNPLPIQSSPTAIALRTGFITSRRLDSS